MKFRALLHFLLYGSSHHVASSDTTFQRRYKSKIAISQNRKSLAFSDPVDGNLNGSIFMYDISNDSIGESNWEINLAQELTNRLKIPNGRREDDYSGKEEFGNAITISDDYLFASAKTFDVIYGFVGSVIVYKQFPSI